MALRSSLGAVPGADEVRLRGIRFRLTAALLAAAGRVMGLVATPAGLWVLLRRVSVQARPEVGVAG